jgi:hypothetical protein
MVSPILVFSFLGSLGSFLNWLNFSPVIGLIWLNSSPVTIFRVKLKNSLNSLNLFNSINSISSTNASFEISHEAGGHPPPATRHPPHTTHHTPHTTRHCQKPANWPPGPKA